MTAKAGHGRGEMKVVHHERPLCGRIPILTMCCLVGVALIGKGQEVEPAGVDPVRRFRGVLPSNRAAFLHNLAEEGTEKGWSGLCSILQSLVSELEDTTDPSTRYAAVALPTEVLCLLRDAPPEIAIPTFMSVAQRNVEDLQPLAVSNLAAAGIRYGDMEAMRRAIDMADNGSARVTKALVTLLAWDEDLMRTDLNPEKAKFIAWLRDTSLRSETPDDIRLQGALTLLLMDDPRSVPILLDLLNSRQLVPMSSGDFGGLRQVRARAAEELRLNSIAVPDRILRAACDRNLLSDGERGTDDLKRYGWTATDQFADVQIGLLEALSDIQGFMPLLSASVDKGKLRDALGHPATLRKRWPLDVLKALLRAPDQDVRKAAAIAIRCLYRGSTADGGDE